VTEAPIKLGLVGLGYWGPSLLRALFELPGVEVVWICDSDAERLERYGRRYPSASQTRRIDDLLADERVDGVVIATPVFTHYYLASRSLEAGKHTFVEKPLAASSAEADTLVTMADHRGLALMCGHTFVYSPAVRAVKGLLEREELGQVFFVSSSRVNLGLHQRDISVIWDLGPHDFSILLYWFGEMPTTVRAVGRDSIVKGVADVAFVTLNFPSGLIANVELSWLAPSKLRRTVVVGSEKMVVYDDGSPEPIRVFDHGVVYEDPETFGEYQLSYRTGDIVSPKIANDEPIVLELGDFADMVRAGHAPDWHVELARNVAHLTEAAEESLRSGGAEVAPARSNEARFARSPELR
jgi:predicted dehydrogenase